MDFCEYDNIVALCKKVGVEKNKVYGDNNLIEFGKEGLIIRMADKMSRLKYFKEHNKLETGEAADAFLDIINYAIYALMMDKIKEGEK